MTANLNSTVIVPHSHHLSVNWFACTLLKPWCWCFPGHCRSEHFKLYGIITCTGPPVAQWLARRIVGRKAWGSNPIRVMWDFSALAGSYPELGVLWAQWEGWNHTAELHPLHGCVFEGVALIIWPTLQVPQFPGLVNTGIIVTVSVVCGPVK